MNFEKALKVVEEELKEELQTPPEEFLSQLWTDAITKEFKALKSWDFEKFEKAVKKELEERNWDIYQFRNTKGEPITNVFKKLVRMIAKEEGQEISNDSLSRILNAVRKQYSSSGKIAAGLYPPVAFHEREEWSLPDDLGDSNSCFHQDRGNEGNVDWLIQEYEIYERAFFVVFYYKKNDIEGVGRCWVYYELPELPYWKWSRSYGKGYKWYYEDIYEGENYYPDEHYPECLNCSMLEYDKEIGYYCWELEGTPDVYNPKCLKSRVDIIIKRKNKKRGE